MIKQSKFIYSTILIQASNNNKNPQIYHKKPTTNTLATKHKLQLSQKLLSPIIKLIKSHNFISNSL